MQIIINDTNELSDLDLRVLRALAGDADVKGEGKAPIGSKDVPKKSQEVKAEEPEDEPEADETEAPVKQKRTRRTKAQIAADEAEKAVDGDTPGEPEDEPDDEPDEDEDLVGGEPTMAHAVAQATKLVSSGRAAEVKAALAEVGAKRVSELKGKAIGQFLDSLKD